MRRWTIIRTALAAAVVAASPVAAQPQTWRPSSSNQSGRAYINTSSISRTGDKVRFWAEIRLYRAESLDGGTRYNRLGVLLEVDCRTRTRQIVEHYFGMDGERLGAFPGNGTVEPVGSGTTAETDLRAVCFNDWIDE